MKKEEYMSRLEEALKNCALERKQEILSDFNEHFVMGLTEGRSEEEICESLGDISDFIDELIIEKQEIIPYNENNVRKIKIMSDMSDIIVDRKNEIGYYLKNWNSMTQIYFDFETGIQGDTQYFYLKSKRKFGMSLKTPELHVSIPKGYIVEIKEKLGDIKVDGSFEIITIENKMGDIDVSGEAQESKIQNDLGDIDLDLNAGKAFVAVNKGDIEGKVIAKNISVETKMGNIELETTITESGSFKSKMGDVEIVPVDMDDYEIEPHTNLGDISCDLEDIEYSHQKIKKGNGKVKINLYTALGDIEIKDKLS